MTNGHSLTDELLNYIFDGQPHVLSPPMAAWLSSSRRFTTFVNTFRDKIRKKRRATRDLDSLLDLRLEWETAYVLLQEPALSLVYEPQPHGPDFAVTFTTRLTFMVEVTRLRAEAPEQPVALPALARLGERIADAACGKLGQLLPQRSHVLVVGVEALHLAPDALRAAMLRSQHRAERNDPTFLQRHPFRDRADFFRHYQRLSEILVRGPQVRASEPPIVWVNPQAKHPLPSQVRDGPVSQPRPIS